jgi:hypothetical protein
MSQQLWAMAGHPQHYYGLRYSGTAATYPVSFESTTSSEGRPWVDFFDWNIVSSSRPRSARREAKTSIESVIVICIVRITYIMSLQRRDIFPRKSSSLVVSSSSLNLCYCSRQLADNCITFSVPWKSTRNSPSSYSNPSCGNNFQASSLLTDQARRPTHQQLHTQGVVS